ncbi:MAG: hypothetical protein LN560_00755 [Rickettsia endosymbiont of Sceptobius lativentris]|nr:hypothetical protein [Rickettsia endosymbiont of Sceptobius lativentris]
MKKLIEFLEKRGLYTQANDLKNGAISLNLRDHKIRAEGAKILAETLKSNNSITKIDLTNNQTRIEGTEVLAEALKNNNSLIFLEFQNNNIGEMGIKFLAEAITINNSITWLNLYYNNIGVIGTKALAEGITINSSITYLGLGNNKIEAEGTKFLAESLKSNNSITWLSIYHNNIRDTGTKFLAEALKNNKTLTSLDLSSNHIGISGKGVKALVEALKINSSLTSLNLADNYIGESFAEVLKTNNSLTSLNLSNNRIIGTRAKAFTKALKINSSLTSLDLTLNSIETEIYQIVYKYLQRNKTLAEKKPEALNTESNDLYNQTKHSEAIEKYKIAIKINEQPLYKENKAIAEKKYEEQQQSLKLEQATLVITENKTANIKDLPKENIKEKLATFQNMAAEAISKLENSTTINEQDKAVLQDRINEISRTVKTFTNKDDINTMIKAVEELARGKITKARIAVVEEDLSEIIEQQIKLDEQVRTEKLTIFQNVVANMTTKIESSTTINARDKDVMQNSIKGIAWILHEGGIYKNKMAISLISGHGYVNFHLNYV